MISIILAKKIVSLFLVAGMGYALVKTHLLKSEDSRVLSLVSLYLIMPCVIVNAFQVEFTPERQHALLLSFAAAILVHLLLLVFGALAAKPLHLDGVELTSVLYSNAGNLIIPIVTAILGAEWVVYTSAFISVQLILLWTHGKMVLCGEHGLGLKKILTNVNFLAVLVGILCFLLHIQFPATVQDSLTMMGGTIGPVAMLILGMLIAGMDLRRIFRYPRLWLVVALRLLAVPLCMAALFRFSPLATLVPQGRTVLLITLLATATPSASTITQMAQVYGKDADYASVINVTSTLLCLATMPLIVALYQM